MGEKVRVRGVRRKDVDTAGLALAFLMLARLLHEQEAQPAREFANDADETTKFVPGTNEPEATS